MRVKGAWSHVTTNEVAKDASELGRPVGEGDVRCRCRVDGEAHSGRASICGRGKAQSTVRPHDRTDWRDESLLHAVIFKKKTSQVLRRYGRAEGGHLRQPVARLRRRARVEFDSITPPLSANKQIPTPGRDRTCQSKQRKHADLSPDRC